MSARDQNPLAGIITMGLVSWAAMSSGFFGLKVLMQHRPEFVGQPMRVNHAELVQESPQIVARKVTDDISVIKPAQPEFSDVRFDMNSHRDHRGLRTIIDMSGEFRARYVLTNSFAEPVFVLFKCPHPRTENAQGLHAGDLRLQASTGGVQENSKDAWFWSGTIEPGNSSTIEVSYRVSSLKGVTYRVTPQNGEHIKQLRTTFRRHDLTAMRFESGDGTKRPVDDTVVWERKDFLAPDFFSAHIEESRNLYASLSRLLDIGPLISFLFLLAVSAAIMARQKLTAMQVLTIAAGYAIYFPLILYLSANLSFVWALVIAVGVPGVLLANYARWLLGSKAGLVGAAVFLALYQVFPTLAALAGWNRGMVLLCLGIVTLGVLINLQNRALRERAPAFAALLALLLFPMNVSSAQVQVLLPAELAGKLPESRGESTNAQVAFEPAKYKMQQETTHFRVEAQVPFEVARAGDSPLPLFGVPVYLQESEIESPESDLARLVTATNRLALLVQRTGKGTLRLLYRVPITNREGKKRADIPLVGGLPGNVQLDSAHSSFEILTGSVWAITTADKTTSYEVGVAAAETLVVEWRDDGASPAVAAKLADGSKEFYGIGLTRAQNLTIINSDSSCTHFAEFEVPVSQSDEFRIKLPAKARLISVSVNGTQISSPTLDDQLCRVRLPARDAQQTAHRLSFRIAYPPLPLGFVGTADLTLPEVFQTVGTLEWIVALPNGFETQVISSGLQTQKSAPDLSRFGDYGRILKSRPHTYLAKDLAPPGSITLSLRYRQLIDGIYEARAR